jgi:hypothetical protein
MKEPLRVGDRVRDRNSTNAARVGVVISLTLPNPPWHEGERPYVKPDDGGVSGYWHYAELLP